MSTTIPCAHEIREHLQNSRFTDAVDIIKGYRSDNEGQRRACTLVIEALKKASLGPARDNGLASLFQLLIELGDAGQALATMEAIGTDSHLSRSSEAFNNQLSELVERQREAIRLGGRLD